MSELLPCPFCGQKGRLERDHETLTGKEGWRVRCVNTECAVVVCTDFTPGDGRLAAEQWNTRRSDPNA